MPSNQARASLIMRAMTNTLRLAVVLVAAFAFGCSDEKADTGGATDKPAEPAEGKSAGGDTAQPEQKKPEPKPPAKMAALALPEWGIEMQAAEGAKLGSFEKGGDLPGSAKIEGACGEEELEVYRHDGNTLDGQFKNSTGNTEHDAKYPVKEKTDTGFTVKKTWTPPLGQVWSGEAAVVAGKHTYLCGLGTMLGVDDEALADCAIAACSSIKEAGAK